MILVLIYRIFKMQTKTYSINLLKSVTMKKSLLLCLIIPMLLLSCTQEKVSPMEGAWKLAYEYEVSGDNTTLLFPGASQGSEIKMW